jgi:hypothetical protein
MLHLPGEWKDHMFLADTILPWTSAWLMHYELLLSLGYWTGTGDQHPVPSPANRIRRQNRGRDLSLRPGGNAGDVALPPPNPTTGSRSWQGIVKPCTWESRSR